MAGGAEIREEPLSELRRHVLVRSCFETAFVLDVHEGAKGLELRERRLDNPYRKDYDSLENPLDWPRLFDVSNWAIMGAFHGNSRIGGVVVAFDSPGVDMLEGRRDLAVIWDLRVAQDAQRRGVGAGLVSAVEAWARMRHCSELKVETQNTNVVACRFYARQGFRLAQANRNVYRHLPADVQLIWRKGFYRSLGFSDTGERIPR